MKIETQTLETAVEAAKLLTSSLPTDGKVEVLKHLLGELTDGDLSALSSDARVRADLLQTLPEAKAVSRDAEMRALITNAGGIFIGKEELVKLGKIAASAKIPAIPEKYSAKFLESKHPLRDGTVAAHVILGFDTESKQWHCIDRGQGGVSDIVPGSLGRDGNGLSGSKQDELIRNVKVEEVRLKSPEDSYPIERILDNAIALHMSERKSVETLPFRGIWGRTADTERGAAGCRVLLGRSNGNDSLVYDDYHSDYAVNLVGLLACWN